MSHKIFAKFSKIFPKWLIVISGLFGGFGLFSKSGGLYVFELNENQTIENFTDGLRPNFFSKTTLINTTTIYDKICDGRLKPPYLDPNLFANVSIAVSPACRQSTLNAIAIIISAPGNFERRNFHRNTLGSAIPVYFVLGRSNKVEKNSLIANESHQFHDIIQGNFIDHYFWLSLKTFLKLLWVKLACKPAPKFVIYFDDDTVIDLIGIMKKLNAEFASTNEPKIIGHESILSQFERNPCSKWFVPEYLYPEKFVPIGLNYALGYFVITLNGAHEKLLNAPAKTRKRLVWHEDVTFYGILRNESGIELTNWNQHAYPIWYQKERYKKLELLKQRGVQLVLELMNKTRSNRYLFAHLGRADFYHMIWNSFNARNA